MTPFFFGSEARRLYGAYHAPEVTLARAPAVLLCDPFGEEASRSFRAYRLLAERLAANGAHVLRFNYYGTGDSAGACEEAALSGYAEDIRTAHQELIAMSGVTRAIWIGLRLGASAAALAAQVRVRGLSGVVLWEPVVSGETYLKELATSHINYLAGGFDQPLEAVRHRLSPIPDPITEALGFPIGPQMGEELKKFDMMQLEKRPARSTLVIASKSPPTDPALKEKLEGLRAKVDWREDEEEVSWNSDAALNDYIVPVKTIDQLVAAIGEWR